MINVSLSPQASVVLVTVSNYQTLIMLN